VALAIFVIIFGISFTTSDGIAQGIYQFLAVLATLPLVIYMGVVFLRAWLVKQRQPRMPNQAL
jgi:hypothetical protein